MTLLEVIVALSIIALSSIGLAQLADRYATDVKNTVVADQLKRTAEAARSYIKDNYTTIVSGSTATQPFLITNAMLVAGGYLPTGTPATNGFSQNTCTLVLQPSANKLQGLVVTEGGTTVDDVTMGALVNLVGSSSGSVLSTNAANITGAMGGWSMPVATYDNRTNNQNRRCDGTTSGAVRVQVGHNAVALWFENSFAQASTLYRDAVPGQPQLNQVNTPIIFNTTQTLGAGCSPQGALANTSVGAVINCTGGTWKAMGGSAYWADPVGNTASLGACNASNTGVTRVVQSPSVGSGPRAYACTGSSWAALAVDDSGNLTVSNTLSAGAVSAGTVSATQLNGTNASIGGTLSAGALSASSGNVSGNFAANYLSAPSANITSLSSSSVSTNTVTLNGVATAGGGCSPNGTLARDTAGAILSCESGVWTKPGGSGGKLYAFDSSTAPWGYCPANTTFVWGQAYTAGATWAGGWRDAPPIQQNSPTDSLHCIGPGGVCNWTQAGDRAWRSWLCQAQ